MKRRNFLVGVGGTAVGASALVGSGAFSRVESDRKVDIAVAKDPNAYLGLDRCPGSDNSDNYTGLDDGHGYIDIGENEFGDGINSNSNTYFDDLFQVTNQGKEDAYLDFDDVPDEVTFYTGAGAGGPDIDEVDGLKIKVGEPVCIGLKVNSSDLDSDDTIDETVTVIADVNNND